VEASLQVSLTKVVKPAFNVVGRLASTAPAAQRLPGVVVVGAHYDHLGMGGNGSLAPDKHEPHLGADDNASGTSTMLEVARTLAASPDKLRRDVVFIAFSGEELGVLGSTEWTRHPTAGVTSMKDVAAMLNMDMVGRMRDNKLSVLGADSATEWRALAQPACDAARVDCTLGGDGYGPSDQTPFYAAGVPVLFFFTGAHGDYHKPSDTADKVNAAGAGQVARIVADATLAVSARDTALTYRSVAPPAPCAATARRSGRFPITQGRRTDRRGCSSPGCAPGALPMRPGFAAGMCW
jgi:Zn-dependent M28 family amino/carboxypeptidase